MINPFKILFLSLFFVCLSVKGFAQLELRGTVTNLETGDPLRGVEVFDDISSTIVITDKNGAYLFEDLPSGSHAISTFSLEYATLTKEVELDANQILDLQLERLEIDLTAVEISARRQELFAMKRLMDVEGTSVFAGKKTEVVVMDLLDGNLASNNGRQVYAQVAGLNIYEGSDGGLQLNIGGRGLDPNRSANFNTRQNGYDISADVLGYPENYYTPPSEGISEVQIIRGASSLQYGTQFGGLINFKMRAIPTFEKINIRTNQTVGSFGAFNSFNYVGFNAKKLSVNTFYNYKEGNGYRDNSDFESHNLFISGNYQLSKKTRLIGEFTYFQYLAKQAGGLTDEQFDVTPRLSTRSRNWFEVDWKLYNLKLEHEFNAKNRLDISLFGLDASRQSLGYRGNPTNLNENPITSLDEQDANGNFISPRDLIIGNFRNIGAEAKFLKKYTIKDKDAVLLLGAKYFQSNNTSIQGPGSRGIDADFTLRLDEFPDYPNQSDFRFPNLNFAVFGEHIFYLNERLSITPGFRLESIKTVSDGVYNQVIFDNAGNAIANNELSDDRSLDRFFGLFGIGLSYKKNDQLNLYANISQNYRSVTFSDIRVVSPTFIVDPDISDEKGFTADIGLRGRINKTVSYDVSTYAVLYDDRIGVILDDRANRVRKNIGKALIAGVESLVDFNIAEFVAPDSKQFKLNWFVNSALTFSEYIDSEENNVIGKKVEFIPVVNLKTGIKGGYKNLKVGLQFTYLSKQFTDVQNSERAQIGDIRSGVIGEIPSYGIVDLSLSHQFKSIKLEAGINNLLDEAYFTRRATGYPGPGIIPSDGRSFYCTVSYRFNK